MIVPFAKGPMQAQGPQGQMPSETNLLMALAQMHKMGQFDVSGDVIDKSQEFGEVQKANRRENAGGFREGVPSAPIIPMTPATKDKG